MNQLPLLTAHVVKQRLGEGFNLQDEVNHGENDVEDGHHCFVLPSKAVKIPRHALDFIVHTPCTVDKHHSGRRGRLGGCNVQRRQASDGVTHEHGRFSNDVVDKVNNLCKKSSTAVRQDLGVPFFPFPSSVLKLDVVCNVLGLAKIP